MTVELLLKWLWCVAQWSLMLSSVPPDIQIEDAGKSLAPWKMEILGSHRKAEFVVATWVYSHWVKMRTALLEEPPVPILWDVFFFFPPTFSLLLVDSMDGSISIDEHFVFPWTCTSFTKADHTSEHFNEFSVVLFVTNQSAWIIQILSYNSYTKH